MGRVIIIRGSVVIALSANEQRNREHSNATPCPTLQLTLITLPIIFLKLANCVFTYSDDLIIHQ